MFDRATLEIVEKTVIGGKAVKQFLYKKDIKPSKIMTKGAFENAIRVDMTMGGSTNAVLHIPAIARELGIDKNTLRRKINRLGLNNIEQ